MQDRLHILLIDDHRLFREGLVLLLRSLAPRSEVMEFDRCESALLHLEQKGVADLALVDLMLPGMPGMQGLVLLRERWPEMPAVALSSDDSPQTIARALDRGAMGFIPKSASSEQLATALRQVLAGNVHVPPVAGLDAVTSRPAPPGGNGSPWGVDPLAEGPISLTPRQADVLRLILQGKPTKSICAELGLSEGTIKTHTSAVLRALNVTTRTQAVVAASRLGLRFDD